MERVSPWWEVWGTSGWALQGTRLAWLLSCQPTPLTLLFSPATPLSWQPAATEHRALCQRQLPLKIL